MNRATTLPVRQFLTSGDAGQTASNDGTFRKLFLRALRGEERVDANGDGFITASEMGLFLGDRVTNLTQSKQTPRYSKLRDADWDRGDFIFSISKTSLSPERQKAPAPQASITPEMMFWQSIQGSQSADAYRAYLKQYPSGIFASLAELKVKELAPPQVASRTPAATSAPTPSPPKKPYPPNARRWLSVQIQQVTNEIAKSLGMPSARGAFIVKALAGSPADKGDMKAEDIILNVGKTNIVQFSDVPKAAASHSPGEKVVIGRCRISDRGIHYWEITLGMLDPKNISHPTCR